MWWSSPSPEHSWETEAQRGGPGQSWAKIPWLARSTAKGFLLTGLGPILCFSEQHLGGGLSPWAPLPGPPGLPGAPPTYYSFCLTQYHAPGLLGILPKCLGSPHSGPPCVRGTCTQTGLCPCSWTSMSAWRRACLCLESPLKLTEGQHPVGHFIYITAHSHKPMVSIFVCIL